jgi:hypothetical protein
MSAVEDEFRDIPDFPRYQASKTGIIRNKISSYRLKPDEGVYPKVNVIGAEAKAKLASIHILVAKAWVHNTDPTTKIHVNLKDGDKSNNHADNLEWVSRAENLRHAREAGLFSEEYRGKQIENIDPATGAVFEWFPSRTSAERQHGLNKQHLARILDTEQEYGGYLWRSFEDPDEKNYFKEEVWKPLSECDGFRLDHIPYSVSSPCGRVRNDRKKGEKGGGVLNQHKDVTTGYYFVCLSIAHATTRRFRVHILVATAFVPKPIDKEKLEVDHIDTDISNNSPDNLQWLARKEHAMKTHGKCIVQKTLKGGSWPHTLPW